MGGSIGDIVSVIPPSFPGVEITSIPCLLDSRLDRLISLWQTRDRIMGDGLVEDLRFRMKHRGYPSRTNRTRVTSIHGVNFSFNAMTSGISSAIFLVCENTSSLDGLVGVVE